MKVKNLLKNTIIGCCALGMFSFHANSFAGVDDLIGGYGLNAAQLLGKSPYDVPYMQFTGGALTASYLASPNSNSPNNFVSSVAQTATAQTEQTLLQLLIGNVVGLADPNKLMNNLVFSLTTNPIATCPDAQPGGSVYVPLTPQGCVPAQGSQVNQLLGVFPSYDLNSLIGPVAYSSQQAQTAKGFINNVAQANTAVPVPDFATAFANKSISSTVFERPDVQKFLSDLRFYLAIRTAALGNFYQMYADRTPTPLSGTSAKNLGLSGDVMSSLSQQQLVPQASALQVEQYMANRRLADPQWYLNLSGDSPAALQRQMVILLAENLAEQYKVRMSLERLNATMSMLLLQQTYTQRALLQSQVPSFTSSSTTSGGTAGQ